MQVERMSNVNILIISCLPVDQMWLVIIKYAAGLVLSDHFATLLSFLKLRVIYSASLRREILFATGSELR